MGVDRLIGEVATGLVGAAHSLRSAGFEVAVEDFDVEVVLTGEAGEPSAVRATVAVRIAVLGEYRRRLAPAS